MKRLFNASFEDSKYLIHKRSWILLPGGDSDAKRIGESLLNGAAFWPTMAMMIILPVMTYYSYSQSMRIFMVILEVIMLGWILFMANIYPRFHHKNWAEMHKKMVPSMLGFFVSMLIPVFPFMKDDTIKTSGVISCIFQVLLVITCFVTCVYYFIYSPLHKIKENKITTKVEKSKLQKLLILNTCFLLLSVITGTVHYFKSGNGAYIDGFLLTILLLVIVIGGFLMFKSYLSYHYIAKYPRQYRLYYKIPDSIWYFSKEEAEKRNDPVYPPKKTTKLNREE